LQWGSGDHESTVKTHKNGESNFHLKGGSGLGPTKQSGAIPAERGHREACLQQIGTPTNLNQKNLKAIVLIKIWKHKKKV